MNSIFSMFISCLFFKKICYWLKFSPDWPQIDIIDCLEIDDYNEVAGTVETTNLHSVFVLADSLSNLNVWPPILWLYVYLFKWNTALVLMLITFRVYEIDRESGNVYLLNNRPLMWYTEEDCVDFGEVLNSTNKKTLHGK